MITLYELHSSHYCEKIRWALDYKKLPWKKVDINAFTKKEMLAYPCPQLVPLIYDDKKNIALSDSTPILRYLDEHYHIPAIFPEVSAEKNAVYQFMIELDSCLGVPARRLAYAQIILENPRILSALFLQDKMNGMLTLPVIRHISSALMGMMLIKRFRFDLNESLYLYEDVENYLLTLVAKLKNQQYLINNQFSAADITLATLLRPLRIVPFFKDNQQLAPLFQWQKNLFREHQREEKLLYEELLEEHRILNAPVRRKLKANVNVESFLAKTVDNNNHVAYNDQEPILTWRILLTPYHYFFTLKENKLRQREISNSVR
jgi:glutathione S-transferase